MIKLIKLELYKIFTKPRTYIGFAAITVIIVAMELGIKMGGNEMMDMVVQNIKDRFLFEGDIINVYHEINHCYRHASLSNMHYTLHVKCSNLESLIRAMIEQGRQLFVIFEQK